MGALFGAIARFVASRQFAVGLGSAVAYKTFFGERQHTGTRPTSPQGGTIVDTNGDGWIDSQDGWDGEYIDGVFYNRYQTSSGQYHSYSDPLGLSDPQAGRSWDRGLLPSLGSLPFWLLAVLFAFILGRLKFQPAIRRRN